MLYEEKITVYVRLDGDRITDINSSAFLGDTRGWTAIDAGTGDRFRHAYRHYLPGRHIPVEAGGRQAGGAHGGGDRGRPGGAGPARAHRAGAAPGGRGFSGHHAGGGTVNVEELARKYYPRLWDKRRIEALVAAGRLSREAAEAILREAEQA